MKSYRSLVIPTGLQVSKVYSAIWNGSSPGLYPLPHVHSSPPEQVRFNYPWSLYTAPTRKAWCWDCSSEQRLLWREKWCPQHSRFSSPADANYSLLNANWGNISPTLKSFRTGLLVFTEQKAPPPSKSLIFFSPNASGKQRGTLIEKVRLKLPIFPTLGPFFWWLALRQSWSRSEGVLKTPPSWQGVNY